jgi:hypothetical protein
VYVLVALSEPVFCPAPDDVAFVPLHDPDAVQVVAFWLLHVNSDEPLKATVVGLAVNVTLGPTLTAADCVVVPPGPVHASVKLPGVVRLLAVSELAVVDLVPDHNPDAVHDVALFVDQEMVVEPP